MRSNLGFKRVKTSEKGTPLQSISAPPGGAKVGGANQLPAAPSASVEDVSGRTLGEGEGEGERGQT